MYLPAPKWRSLTTLSTIGPSGWIIASAHGMNGSHLDHPYVS